MAHFDEKSGAVQCKTEWGCWWQTIDEVFIEIHSEAILNSKDIKCVIKPRNISVHIKNTTILEFQNPGMDFSGATMTGNYHGGGPQLPS
uniref:CS domain-containing protein n=1 Tax=Biomphalaria glabrata TaxID=6526 RepID=A0A2C9LZG2_BIOGL